MHHQHTVSGPCRFGGKGLHTGTESHLTILPAPVDSGIRFVRTDLPGRPSVKAASFGVSNTSRSTTISNGVATAMTIEHLMSALYGLGVDNALIEMDNVEVPILDGSAAPYVESIMAAGVVCQDAEAVVRTLCEPVEVRDENTGSFIRIEPSDTTSYEATVDFSSKVLGVQTVHWDPSVDYRTQIAPCRTFVFFHELEFLYSNNLIKGGDVDNAIVVVENPVSEDRLKSIGELFGMPSVKVDGSGYLNNLELRFPDECGRHKMLDLIGDLSLAGCRFTARVTAFKPGHGINTRAARALADKLI